MYLDLDHCKTLGNNLQKTSKCNCKPLHIVLNNHLRLHRDILNELINFNVHGREFL